MVGLGDLPGGNFSSYARDISADGSVIVGTGDSATGFEAFRWTSGGGMVGLGNLYYTTRGHANAVSGDGSVVGGTTENNFVQEAFIWTPTTGMQAVKQILIYNGLGAQVADWDLQNVTSISADGKTVAGYGVNPSGLTEAWSATVNEWVVVPEPSSLVMGLLAALALGSVVVKRRARAA